MENLIHDIIQSMETIEGADYLLTKDVAEAKDTTVPAVIVAIHRGHLPAVMRLGRWLIRPEDAHAWTPGTWGDISRMKKGEE
jgi:hypothetical protein